MTDKLTLADCMKYPNAKILDYTSSEDNPNEYKNIYDYIYKQGSFDSRNLEYTPEDIFNDYFICNCKLILREITDLTDEEIKKCLDIALWSEDGVPMDKRSITINEKNKKHWDCSLSKTQRDLADYLKEINVDIYGFFECGKAEKE